MGWVVVFGKNNCLAVTVGDKPEPQIAAVVTVPEALNRAVINVILHNGVPNF
jgi:hypothetical protein